jgi:hypothetical protein
MTYEKCSSTFPYQACRTLYSPKCVRPAARTRRKKGTPNRCPFTLNYSCLVQAENARYVMISESNERTTAAQLSGAIIESSFATSSLEPETTVEGADLIFGAGAAANGCVCCILTVA